MLGDSDGAFVNVLTWAVDREEFRRKVQELMDYLSLSVVSIERAEPLKDRGPEDQLEEEIVRIAKEVRANPNAVMYSTFHTWRGPIQ